MMKTIFTGTGALQTIPPWIAGSVVWLIFFFTAGTAFCDSISSLRPLSLRSSIPHYSRTRMHCEGTIANKFFCDIETRQNAHRYPFLQNPGSENRFDIQNDIDPPRADLLFVFQLAIEELDLFPSLRLRWRKTERYIDELSVKLRLKGEIPIGDPSDRLNEPYESARRGFGRTSAKRSSGHNGFLSLLMPQTIKWNMGINPQDLSFFMDVHMNPYLSFSSEFGDESRVGIFFTYNF